MNIASIRSAATRTRRIDFQNVEGSTVADVEAKAEKKTFLRDSDFGEIHEGTFEITVKSPEEKDEKGNPKVLYTNKAERYEYERVVGFANLLKKEGAKLDDTAIDMLNQGLAGSEETGKAVAALITMANAKYKSDAKSSAYQAIVNKYKPLEGEKRETAIARTIKTFVQLSGITVETAIEVLKGQKAVPEDYTVADYLATKLRKTKGDDEDDSE